MEILRQIVIFLSSFLGMQAVAWFSRKYILHGSLWSLHRDHPRKEHSHWWECNELFFVFAFYALLSIGLFLLWRHGNNWWFPPAALGILDYGITYFIIHDLLINQQIRSFQFPSNRNPEGRKGPIRPFRKTWGKKMREISGCSWCP